MQVTAPIQQLRCRACFYALRWSPRITDAAHAIRSKLLAAAATAHTPGYLALHLRLEKDSLSHSGCRIQSGNASEAQEEDKELTLMSKKLWKVWVAPFTSSPPRVAHSVRLLYRWLTCTPVDVHMHLAGHAQGERYRPEGSRALPPHRCGGGAVAGGDGLPLQHAYLSRRCVQPRSAVLLRACRRTLQLRSAQPPQAERRYPDTAPGGSVSTMSPTVGSGG
jgi:hypothetical protein